MPIPQQVTREQLKGSYSEGEALAIYNEVKKTGQWLSFLKTFLHVFYTELMDELRRSLESMDRAYHQKSTTSSAHYGACSSDSSLVCCVQRYTLHLNNCVTILFVCGIFIMTMELVNDEDENEHTIRTTRRLP